MNKIRLLTMAYFVIAVALRFLPHGVNFNAIGALALFAGCYLTATQGILIGVGAMAVSDTLGHMLDWESMGYYHRPTMLAVYLCAALPSLLGWALRGRANLVTVPSAAIGSSVIFFLVTNFASWLDPNMNYPQTFAGLLQSYVAAIPFAGNHFTGTLIFASVFFGLHASLSRATAGQTQRVS
ncbi:MAG: hypothetical protein IT423_02180 [Pirellulaceae bacterium]|nr:hypothetical protein [Pirellulaceae bacterium]